MRLQFLVSAVKEDVGTLAERMNLQADAIIVNQCGENAYQEYEWEGHTVRCYSFAERGVGLSRNNCLMRADGDICMFADEDIIYDSGAAGAILAEFEKNPDADMILFNLDVPEERRTYHNENYGRVRWYNCGRYPTYSFAARTEALHRANMSFSLLFGGGARYSNGEDSLFLAECIRKGLKVYRTPVSVGRENGRPSTWFFGYNEKFFYDRGVLYRFLYRRMAVPMAVRFLWKHRKTMFQDAGKNGCPGLREAFRLMKKGIRMEE